MQNMIPTTKAPKTPAARANLDSISEKHSCISHRVNHFEGKYDLGHVTGHEFWREQKMAMEKGWSQKQFNDYMNNPDFYRIEDPHCSFVRWLFGGEYE